MFLVPLDHDFGVCQPPAYHVCERRPKPKAWAGLGFRGPKARAWILSGPHQAELSRAGPAHHYESNPTKPKFLTTSCDSP